MTPQPIPDEHHVSRIAKNKNIGKDLAGRPKVDIEIFRLRPTEKYLSVNWLEYFQGCQREQLDQVRDALVRKGYTVRDNAKFAVFNVNEIKTVSRSNDINLSVKTTDDQIDPSHSGICGLPQNPEDVIKLQIIAQCAKVQEAWG